MIPRERAGMGAGRDAGPRAPARVQQDDRLSERTRAPGKRRRQFFLFQFFFVRALHQRLLAAAAPASVPELVGAGVGADATGGPAADAGDAVTSAAASAAALSSRVARSGS